MYFREQPKDVLVLSPWVYHLLPPPLPWAQGLLALALVPPLVSVPLFWERLPSLVLIVRKRKR